MVTTRMDAAALSRLCAEHRVPAGAKGLPAALAGVSLAEAGGLGLNALSFPTPVAVLKESALAHNIAVMHRYCADRGVWLAPHGKTTMAPQLFGRQMEAGCWALTAATPTQARVYRSFGVRRVLLANQLVEPAEIGWVAGELDTDPEFEFICLVDSVDGVRLLESELATAGARRPVRVLVEVGHAGGRAGCRTPAAVAAVADALRGCRHLEPQGVECFEGLIHRDTPESTLAAVDAHMAFLSVAMEAIAPGVPSGVTPVVSAGGSAYFDRVVEAFAGGPWQVVLRSGCYVAHDAGAYARWSPFGTRLPGYEPLRNALEVWSAVLSRPEPGLILTSMGRRDVSHDGQLPRVFALRPDGPVEGARVVSLNDQHAHIEMPPDLDIRPGHLVGCAPSHPCTTFDKWRYIPVVDDTYTMTNLLTTFF